MNATGIPSSATRSSATTAGPALVAENLGIDHIDGNGRAHRIELFGSPNSSGAPFWSWLVKNGFPEGFQTLCSRCNHAKGAARAYLLHPLSHLPEAEAA